MSKAVKEAAPANKGNTRGTMLAFPLGPSSLNTCTPKSISTASTKSTIDPATAKLCVSTPKILSIGSPIKRKASNITHDQSVTVEGLIFCPLSLRLSTTGMAPTMSTAIKRVIKARPASPKLNADKSAKILSHILIYYFILSLTSLYMAISLLIPNWRSEFPKSAVPLAWRASFFFRAGE